MNQPSLTVHNRQGYESSRHDCTIYYDSGSDFWQVTVRFRQNIFVKKIFVKKILPF